MFAWVIENLATIIIAAVLLAVVILIVAYLVRKKRRGETSCGCGCSDCAMSDSCSKKRQ